MQSVVHDIALASLSFPNLPLSATLTALACLLAAMCLLTLALLWLLHRAHERLREGERHARAERRAHEAVLDALPFPVLVKDPQGACTHSNRAARQHLEMSAGNASGQQLAERSTDDTPAAPWLTMLDARIREHGEYRAEIAYTDIHGQRHDGLWWERAIEPAAGTVGALLDVSAYRQAEREARQTEHSLRAVACRLPVAVFTLQRDSDGRCRMLFLTGDTGALCGMSPEDFGETDDILRDWPFREHVHPDDLPAFRNALVGARRKMQAFELDFRVFGSHSLRCIHMTVAPRHLDDGAIHWLGYCIDTTHLNAHNETLRIARDAAERAAKAKADFLARMSHEIRTPMNGVIGLVELLGHTQLDHEQRQMLGAVEDSAAVLLQILNDVLDFSRLESGELQLEEAPFDPRELCDHVLGSMAHTAQRKNLRLQVAVDAAVAGSLRGDGVRLRQVLLNLLSNACKFTDQGSVLLRIGVLGDDGDSQRLRISVSDTGIGIVAEKLEKLFTPFVQAEPWITRQYGGTGLGLAICRQLVRLMGGNIALSSEPGTGTTVKVELRLPIVARHAESPATLRGRHALIRLDDAAVVNGLAEYLDTLGLSVERLAPDLPWREGIAAQLVFIDSGASLPTLPAAIVECDPMPGATGLRQEGERLLLATSPLRWQSLLRACVLALEPRRTPRWQATLALAETDLPPPEPRCASATASSPARRILVAEDHPVSRQLVRRQLDLLGGEADVVADGAAALAALRRGGYGLLLTDCHMPGMDGYTLTEHWRQHEARHGLPRLPILAMTANAWGEDLAHCRRVGMDDHLTKPVQLHALQQKIAHWLAQAGDPRQLGATTETEPQQPELDTFRPEMLRVMVQTSLDDLDALDRAIGNVDAQSAIEHLHRVLGALTLFTDDALIGEGRRQLAALHGDTPDAAMGMLPGLIQRLRALLSTLAGDSAC